MVRNRTRWQGCGSGGLWHVISMLIADAADVSHGLPNLSKVTGLGGFEVDVVALRRVASSDGLEEFGDGTQPYPMAGVRTCTRGESEVPMEVLLAACVLRATARRRCRLTRSARTG